MVNGHEQRHFCWYPIKTKEGKWHWFSYVSYYYCLKWSTKEWYKIYEELDD